MEHIKTYQERLLNLEKIVEEKNISQTVRFPEIEGYFNMIKRGIHALEQDNYKHELSKKEEIKTLEILFRRIENKINL